MQCKIDICASCIIEVLLDLTFIKILEIFLSSPPSLPIKETTFNLFF